MCMNDTLSSNAEVYKSHFYNDTEIIDQFSNALFHWFSNILGEKLLPHKILLLLLNLFCDLSNNAVKMELL